MLGIIRYSLETYTANVVENKNNTLFNYPCTSHEICDRYHVYLEAGVYYIEAWGAQGGKAHSRTVEGGKGGYTAGLMIINSSKEFELEIGASGLDSSATKTYGGGGKGGIKPSDGASEGGGSGGGATSMLTKSGKKVLVAGGGAGSSYYFDDIPGGDAGGLVAKPGSMVKKGTTPNMIGCGANFNVPVQQGCNNEPDSPYNYYISGGGGGYIPGGRWLHGSDTISSGVGGCGFLSGFGPCQIVDDFTFEFGKILGGFDSFLSPTFVTEIGHRGNGALRISKFSDLYIKTCEVVNHQNFKFNYFSLLPFLF